MIVVKMSPSEVQIKNFERLRETQAFAREKLYYALNLLELSTMSIEMLKEENIVEKSNDILASSNLLK